MTQNATWPSRAIWPLASTLPDVVDEIATIKSGDAPTAEKYEYKGDCD
jgi:hypothetical protein